MQTHPDDRTLTRAFQAGDIAAFDHIYEMHHKTVSSVCRRMLVSKEEAEEATQETFLRVYQGLKRFNGRYLLRAWIARIATNVCLDALRASNRRPRLHPLEAGLNVAEKWEDAPEGRMLRASEGSQVRQTLDGLPPLHRAAVVLRDVEGFSYDEIATALGMTSPQVKALIHRARQGFKKSWLRAVAHALVPSHLLARLKTSFRPTPEATRLGEIAANSSSYAASCSTLIQQCGQFATERAAVFITAIVVGGAAISGVAPSGATPSRDRSPGTEAMVPVVIGKRLEAKTQRPSKAHRKAALVVATEPVVDPEPVPAPEEPAEPAPSDPQPSASPAAAETPAEPSGFGFAFHSDAGPETPCTCYSAGPVEEMSALEWDAIGLASLEHRASGVASVGSSHLRTVVTQAVDYNEHSLSFSLVTPQGTYTYAGSGMMQGMSNEAWGGLTYRYEGTYEVMGRPTLSERVPEAGSYLVAITVSRSSDRVVSVSVTLMEEPGA